MDPYRLLAGQLLASLDHKCPKPPIDDGISRVVRGEMAVMRLLQEEGRGVIVGEISRFLGMTTSRVAAVLNSLERKGLIQREADAADRRRVSVHLTPEGEAFCTAQREKLLAKMAGMLAALGEEDARQLVRIVGRIRDTGIEK